MRFLFLCLVLVACHEADPTTVATNNVQSSDSTDSTDGFDPTDATDAIDYTDGSDATDSVDSDETTDSTDGSNATDGTAVTDSTDSTDTTDGTDGPVASEEVDTTDSTDMTDSSYGSDATDSTEGDVKCTTNEQCEDGNGCNIDMCNWAGFCQHTSLGICNDNDWCTKDSCFGDGECVYEADPDNAECKALCDDGNPCTNDNAWSSPGTGGCSNLPIICNDGDWGTDDVCDSDIGKCVFTELLVCVPSFYTQTHVTLTNVSDEAQIIEIQCSSGINNPFPPKTSQLFAVGGTFVYENVTGCWFEIWGTDWENLSGFEKETIANERFQARNGCDYAVPLVLTGSGEDVVIAFDAQPPQ